MSTSAWPVVPLEQLVDPNRPITYGIVQPGPDIPGGVPYVRVVDMQNGAVISQQLRRTSPDIAQSYRRSSLSTGDLLISIRGHVGRTAIVTSDIDGANLTQDTARVAVLPPTNVRYIQRYVESANARHWLTQHTKGVAVTGINLTDLRRLPVPVPPPPEQRRIADILDKADAIRRKRKQAIALTDQLLRSTFLEMFGDPVANPKRWAEIPFGSLVAETQLGLVRAASEQGPNLQYPYIRMNAIEDNGKLNLSDLSKVDASSEDAMKHQLKEGDFLFNTRNTKELVGKSAVFHGNGLYLFNNNILRVRFRDEYDPDYICSYFQTRRGKADLEKRKSGTTSVFAVYQRSLNEIPILMPPADMQRKYASVCSRVRTITDKLQTSLYCTTNLFDSLVSHTFRGELSTSNQFELQLSMFNK